MQGYHWRLAYSTVKHGTSLKTLYRNLSTVDSPVLLVIKDMDKRVNGVCVMGCDVIALFFNVDKNPSSTSFIQLSSVFGDILWYRKIYNSAVSENI